MNKIIAISAILTAAIFASGVLAVPDNQGYASVICNVQGDCPSGQTCVSNACQPISCGISASSPGGYIRFINVVQGTTVQSSDTTLVTNTGNVPVNPTIYGDNWYASSGNWMPVGQTGWTVSDWTGGHWLSGSPALIGTISPSNTATVYYELVVPGQQPTDTYTQAITFTASC